MEGLSSLYSYKRPHSKAYAISYTLDRIEQEVARLMFLLTDANALLTMY